VGWGLIQALARRLVSAIMLLLAVLILNFTLLHIAPGDVADTIAGDMGGVTAETLARIRAEYGLDQPFPVQLGQYILRVAQFDLGYSYFYDRPVTEMIVERLPATLLLVISAQALALLVGIALGVFTARRPNSIVSHAVTLLALFGFAAPVFWTGSLLLIAFSLKIPLFPVAGLRDVTLNGGIVRQALSVAHHLVLPALTLSAVFIALYARLCRAAMREALASDYVRTARAKGLPPRSVARSHALRNALPPVVTLAGLQFSAVLSGAVLVEAVFSWPGLGQLALTAILARDTPTILGILFLSSLIVIAGNLLTDLVVHRLDPRMRRAA